MRAREVRAQERQEARAREARAQEVRAQETKAKEAKAKEARAREARAKEARSLEVRRHARRTRAEEQARVSGPVRGMVKVQEQTTMTVCEKTRASEPSIVAAEKPKKQEPSPAPFCVVRASSCPLKEAPDVQNDSPSLSKSPPKKDIPVEKSSPKREVLTVAPLPTNSEIVPYPSDSPHLKDWVAKEFDIPSKTASILSGSHGENASFLSYTLRLPISVMAPPPSAFPALSRLQPHTLLLTGKSEGIVNGAQEKIDRVLGNPEPFFHQVKEWTEQKIHVFVDNSNIFLGAQFLDDAQPTKKNVERARDFSVRLKTAALAQLVEGERTVSNRVVFGSSVHDQYKVQTFAIVQRPCFWFLVGSHLLFFFLSCGMLGEMLITKFASRLALNRVVNNLSMMHSSPKSNTISSPIQQILMQAASRLLLPNLKQGESSFSSQGKTFIFVLSLKEFIFATK